MPKNQTYHWQCDICGAVKVAPVKPGGWADFEIDGMLDREGYNKTICDTCCKRILVSLKVGKK